MMKHDYHLCSHHLNGLGCEEDTGPETGSVVISILHPL